VTRLRRVARAALSISRVRKGRGFALVDAAGQSLRQPELRQRVAALGIPPAWTEVRIAAEPDAHIQACGVDAAGRLQYVYHAEWTRRRIRKQQKQLRLLAEALPRLRRRVVEGLGADTGSRELALAIAVALIDRTAMRIGRERYLEINGTRGAGTLYRRDVTVAGDAVCIAFPAKSGKRARYCLTDARLAEALSRILTLPGKRLLVVRRDDGGWRNLRTGEINAFLREVAGVAVTAKDFRTLHASALAGEALAQLVPAESDRVRRRQMAEVTRRVAAFLQNTPAVCRTSYITPCLFRLFDRGRLARLWQGEGESRRGLRQREARLAAVLAAPG